MGVRFGGRQKGTPNKRTAYSVATVLAKHGINPIEEILKLLHELKPDEQVKTLLKLQEYIEPKATLPIEDPDLENPAANMPKEKLIAIIRNANANPPT